MSESGESKSVPFTDAQIEAMAAAAKEAHKECFYSDSNLVDIHADEKWRRCIRAALAAGGLEPCALPVTRDEIARVIWACVGPVGCDYSPEKWPASTNVAQAVMDLLASKSVHVVSTERASDEELAKLADDTFFDNMEPMPDGWTHGNWDDRGPEHKRCTYLQVRAVRSRVEAPLLAEIAGLRGEVQKMRKWSSETLSENNTIDFQCDALRNDLAASQARVADLEAAGFEFVRQSDGLVAALRAELEAVKAERDAQLSAAIKMSGELQNAQMCRDEALKALDTQLAALRQRESVPVKVRFDVTAEEAARTTQDIKSGIRGGVYSAWGELGENYKEDFIKVFERLLPRIAECAVIDVTAGVPSVEELVKAGQAASVDVMEKIGLRASDEYDTAFATAIRDRVLAGVAGERHSQEELIEKLRGEIDAQQHRIDTMKLPPTPAPTPEQVEALAKEIHEATVAERQPYSEISESYKDVRRAQARAAFAHFGTGDGSKYNDLVAFIWRTIGNGEDGDTPIEKIIQDFSDEHRRFLDELHYREYTSAPTPEQVEKLAKIGRKARERELIERPTVQIPALHPSPQTRAEIAGVAAILRAAKPRVDVNCAAVADWLDNYIGDDRFRNWLNSRITFGVEVPPEIGSPGLLITVPKAPIWTGPTRAEAEAKLKEIRSRQDIAWHVLREFERWLLPLLPLLPETAVTGWELDVTAEEVSKCFSATSPLIASMDMDDLIDWFRSRIRPVACKECEIWKTTYQRDKAAWDDRASRAVRALEGE